MSTSTVTATTSTRRPKWNPTPPPPPSPKILNLPRRVRHRKQPKKPTKKPASSASKCLHYHQSLLDLHQNYYYSCGNDRKGKLERLFGEEREFSRSDSSVPIVLLNSSSSSLSSAGRRERVENEVEDGDCGVSGGGRGGFVEEKWKFQAEMLRAECNFLRKEREFALKKLERNRVQMEMTLRSAVQTLISGRKNIFQGKNVSAVLEEEIEYLADKLKELQGSSGIKDIVVKNCSNFDKQACLLQRQLEKLGGLSDENCAKDLQEIAESSLSLSISQEVDKESCVSGPRSLDKSTDVEMLRSTLEGLSKEMLDRIEEDFGSILSTTANSSVASSASTSKRIEYLDSTFSSRQQPYQESALHADSKCSGHCKAVVGRIVEQVRAETEQWSQMQGMLGKVREEMEELQASRKFWEDRALSSDHEIKCLHSDVQKWKEKAISSETKSNELQTELSSLKMELERLRTAGSIVQTRDVNHSHNTSLVALSKQLDKENDTVVCYLKNNHMTDHKDSKSETFKKNLTADENGKIIPTTDAQPLSLGKQLEKEKRMLVCRLKERRQTKNEGSRKELPADGRRKSLTPSTELVTRSPFRDIGNSSPLMRHNSKTNFP